MAKIYHLDSRTVVRHRNKRALPVEPTRKQAAVRVIEMRAAHSQPVHDAINQGYAVLITKPREFHSHDLQALRACLGHFGQVSPVFKYGSQVAVLVHSASFPYVNSLQFAIRYPVGTFVIAGTEVTSIVLVHEDGEFLSFSYRVNYSQALVTESQLRSVERNAR